MAPKPLPTVTLNDGSEMPMLAYGTGTALYKSTNLDTIDQTTVSYVKTALALGYLHLDTAELYNTEEEVGLAIKESGIPREKLFITTKVIHNVSNISAGLETSLSKLGLDYVDLYLIHSPWWTKSDEALQKAWKDMEEIKRSGKAKSIGVSNFLIPHLETILETATIIPAVNQVEYHLYLQRGNLVEWSKSKGITTAAYGPLSPITKAKGGPIDSILEKLAKKYGVSAEAVLMKWVMQMGVVVVTTSGKKERLAAYMGCLDVQLSDEEVDEITNVGKKFHFRGNNWGHNYGDSRD